tara:strand:- start:1402 stop:1578 length:177 start_codon:yes stop_codon:yes gene_type:complete
MGWMPIDMAESFEEKQHTCSICGYRGYIDGNFEECFSIGSGYVDIICDDCIKDSEADE